MLRVIVITILHTPYSKMAANKLFFCLHVYWPSLPHFHFKILLCFLHADEASRANLHADKRIIYWPPFWNKVYMMQTKKSTLPSLNVALSTIVITLAWKLTYSQNWFSKEPSITAGGERKRWLKESRTQHNNRVNDVCTGTQRATVFQSTLVCLPSL